MTKNSFSFPLTHIFQCVLLLADMTFNSVVGIFIFSPQIQMIIYIIQDVCLLVSGGFICVLVFSSWYCTSGFVSPLFRKFAAVIVVWTIYFALSLGLHAWCITQWYAHDQIYLGTIGYQAFHVIHRTLSYFYYYLYYRKSFAAATAEFQRDGFTRNSTQEFDVNNIQEKITVIKEGVPQYVTILAAIPPKARQRF